MSFCMRIVIYWKKFLWFCLAKCTELLSICFGNQVVNIGTWSNRSFLWDENLSIFQYNKLMWSIHVQTFSCPKSHSLLMCPDQSKNDPEGESFCLFLIMPVTNEPIPLCSVVVSYVHSSQAYSRTNENFHLQVRLGTQTGYKQTTSSHKNTQDFKSGLHNLF